MRATTPNRARNLLAGLVLVTASSALAGCVVHDRGGYHDGYYSRGGVYYSNPVRRTYYRAPSRHWYSRDRDDHHDRNYRHDHDDDDRRWDDRRNRNDRDWN